MAGQARPVRTPLTLPPPACAERGPGPWFLVPSVLAGPRGSPFREPWRRRQGDPEGSAHQGLGLKSGEGSPGAQEDRGVVHGA